jgi:hypothetical protein
MVADIKETEIVAYHEAGHAVAARVLGFELGDEGCRIVEATTNMGGLASRPQEGMIAVLAGPFAEFIYKTDLLESLLRPSEELSEGTLGTVCDDTAEGMVPEATGDGSIGVADVDSVLDLLAELNGHRFADTDYQKAAVGKVVSLAILGLERKFIEVRIGTDLVVSDEWYVPLRDALDRTHTTVRENWKIIDALATHLIEVKQMPGPEVIAFLDDAGCPTIRKAKTVDDPLFWTHCNPFKKPHDP